MMHLDAGLAVAVIYTNIGFSLPRLENRVARVELACRSSQEIFHE